METAASAEAPLGAMAELVTDFVIEAEVTAKIGAETYERNEQWRASHAGGWHRLLPHCLSYKSSDVKWWRRSQMRPTKGTDE